MNPISHFFVGWVSLERLLPSRRDKALVCLSGLAPDLDGIGIVGDFFTRQFGYVHTDYYQQFHRIYGHGLPAALLIALVVAALSRNRARSAALAFAAVHLHLLCDLLGSRGSSPEDIWPIYYLAPFSLQPQWWVAFQWPLVGWQNLSISAILMAAVMWRAVNLGYSPVMLFSARADVIFVEVLRKWRASLLRCLERSEL